MLTVTLFQENEISSIFSLIMSQTNGPVRPVDLSTNHLRDGLAGRLRPDATAARLLLIGLPDRSRRLSSARAPKPEHNTRVQQQSCLSRKASAQGTTHAAVLYIACGMQVALSLALMKYKH